MRSWSDHAVVGGGGARGGGGGGWSDILGHDHAVGGDALAFTIVSLPSLAFTALAFTIYSDSTYFSKFKKENKTKQ
jgi:hypothetical protein